MYHVSFPVHGDSKGDRDRKKMLVNARWHGGFGWFSKRMPYKILQYQDTFLRSSAFRNLPSGSLDGQRRQQED
jgi:hypothetical protein